MLQRTLYNQPLVFLSPLPSLSAVYSTTLPISPPPSLPPDGQAAAAAASHPPTPRARASLAHLRYQNIPTVSCHSPVRGAWKSSCVLPEICLSVCLSVYLARSYHRSSLASASYRITYVTSHTHPASCTPHRASGTPPRTARAVCVLVRVRVLNMYSLHLHLQGPRVSEYLGLVFGIRSSVFRFSVLTVTLYF